MDLFFWYLDSYEDAFTWIAIASAFLLVAAILITPFLIGALPDDYFNQDKRPVNKQNQYPLVCVLIWRCIKNTLGAVLVISGIAMLVLPGQGILTIFAGLLLMNYPGKYSFEKRLLSHPRVLNIVNWIRRKQNKNTFKL